MILNVLRKACNRFKLRINPENTWHLEEQPCADKIFKGDRHEACVLTMVAYINKNSEEVTNKDFDNYFQEQIDKYNTNYHHKQLYDTDRAEFYKQFVPYHVNSELQGYEGIKEMIDTYIRQLNDKKIALDKYVNYLRAKFPDQKIGISNYYNFNVEKLKDLFEDSIFETLHETPGYQPRPVFTEFCVRLDLILSDKEKSVNQKIIGSIARILYYSPFTKKSLRKGKNSNFKYLLDTFFDIVGRNRPKDDRLNKYVPDAETIMYFGDLLQWNESGR